MIITKHAYKRAKERCGLKKKALERVLPNMIEHGTERRQVHGELRKYLDKIWIIGGRRKQIIVYNQYVFIVDHDILVTVYSVPGRMSKTSCRVTGG